MNERKHDPFALSVELSGIADLSACLSILCMDEEADKPTDETLGNALLAIEYHLERIADDLIKLEVPCKPGDAAESA